LFIQSYILWYHNHQPITILLLDFRYYEDPSDQFRGRDGTILPLWTMAYDKADNLYVTDISWSPDYFDMFAVTLGTCEYYVYKLLLLKYINKNI